MLSPPQDENCCGARYWNAWLFKRPLGEAETLLRPFAWLVDQRLGEAKTQRQLGEVETLLHRLGEVTTLLPRTLLPLVDRRLGEAKAQRQLGEVETLLLWLGEVTTLLPRPLLPLYQCETAANSVCKEKGRDTSVSCLMAGMLHRLCKTCF